MGLKVDFKEVRSKMDAMSKKIATNLADECLDAAEKPLIEAMKTNCPYNPKNSGTHLKDTLDKIKRTGSGSSRKSNVGINSNDRKIIERGYYQEHGHSRMVGKKWMKKSFELSKSEANQEIIKVLKEKLFK